MRPALAAAWEFVPTREDAEDVVQEAFARAWRQMARYDAARPFAPWFFTILRNLARNANRRDRRWSTVSFDENVTIEETTDVVEESDAIDPDIVDAALHELSPMQRACFRLTALEGFGSADAAEMLGIGEATVRVHTHRARKALRARLGAQRGEQP